MNERFHCEHVIVCQTMVENMAICAGDANFRPYPARLVW
jgi:hypothetical protein